MRLSKIKLSAFLLTLVTLHAQAQVNITASGVARESFNGMGTGTTLPTGWRVNTVAGAGTTALSYSTGTTSSLTQAANSGTPTNGGSYNWGTTAGTDRAVGFMTLAGFASPNAVLVNYRNTTGSTITSVTLSYKLERYRTNTDAFTGALYSSTTGALGSWTAQTGGDVSVAVFPAGASAYNFATPGTLYKTVTITGLNIANNGDLYFMWVFGSGSTAGQGIGLDDVTLMAGTGVANVTASLKDVLSNDANSNGVPNTGDKITYNTTIRNAGNAAATSTTYNNALPANTTASGTVRTSALAADDPSYTLPTMGNLLNIAAVAGVLANDFGQPTPTVASFGNSSNTGATVANGTNTVLSDNGATVTMNTNGSFTYNAAAISGFAGYDRFGYTATTGNAPDNDAIVTVAVGAAPVAVNDAYNVVGNVNLQPNAAQGVLANDTGSNKLVIAVNGSASNVGTAITLAQGGTLNVAADGSFTYNPPAGYEGVETFTYTVDNGFSAPSTATATLSISGMVWFVNNAAGTNGDGRLATPFNNLASFNAVNNGTGNNPAAGETIFLYGGGAAYTGGVTLLANQKLIGSAAAATLASITGFTPEPYSAAFPSTNGSPAFITNTAGNDVTLPSSAGSTNTLRGLTLGNATGSAIMGTTFGTLTVADISINTTGQALSLTTGTVNGTFSSIASTSGTNNILFSGCNGTVTIGGGSLSGATAASFSVVGGTISVTTSNSISQSSNAPLVSVSGAHPGTLTFQTGTLFANNGTGLQFDNADGAYNFNGPVTLNGGDAGIDVLSGSNGNFTFGASTAITNPSGTVININTSTSGNFTYSGTFSKTSTGVGIAINSKTGGTVAINGTGTKSLSTSTSNAISLTNNTGSTINFSGNNLSLTTTSGIGFNATGGGTISVTGTGNTITSTTGTTLNVASTTISTAAGASGLTFQSISANGAVNGVALSATGSGALTITGDNGTTNNFSGGTIQNTTGAGISLTTAQNISLDQIRILNTDGSGINGTGVTNFSITNSTITDAGDAVVGTGQQLSESAIAFNGTNTGFGNNLSGILTVTGNTITNPYSSGVDVRSDQGTVSLATISSNTITNPGFSGVNFACTGNASTTFSLTKATINLNTISGSGGNGIQVDVSNANATGPGATAGVVGNPTNIISITGNQVTLDATGTQAITVASSGGNAGSRTQSNFEVSNNGTVANPIGSSSIGTVILIGNNGYSTMTGTLNNNVIVGSHTVAGGAGNGIGGGNGAGGSGSASTPDLTLTVTNNQISGIDGNGILLVGRGGTGIAKLSIKSNTVSAPLSGVRPGIRVDAGNSSSIDDAVCVDIANNTSGGSGGSAGIGVRKQGTNATVNDFGIEGFVGGACANVETYISGLNSGSVLGTAGCNASSRVIVISGDNYANCNTAP
ncbi:MAG TPA: Ig-like domain-containing protein [Fibrella sp.]